MLMMWNLQRSSGCVSAEQVAVGAGQKTRLPLQWAAAKQAEMFRAKMPYKTEEGGTLSFHAVKRTQLHSAPS